MIKKFIFRTKSCVQLGLLLGGMLLAVGFWGIAFPQYLFTRDCVKIVDEEGQDVTKIVSQEKNLYCEISGTKVEQIEVRISILEWAKEKALKKSVEKPDG